MYIRKAKPEDLDQIAALEAECFPPEEAASRERLAGRLAVYPGSFWLGFDDFNTLACYAAGPVTSTPDLTDDLYSDPSCHREDGDWQMLFSVCTHPSFQHAGHASWLLQRVIMGAQDDGRKGIVLTCKEEKVNFYKRFGFESEGLCSSTHGGAQWYQMRLTFDEEFNYSRMFLVSEDPDENNRAFIEMFWGQHV